MQPGRLGLALQAAAHARKRYRIQRTRRAAIRRGGTHADQYIERMTLFAFASAPTQCEVCRHWCSRAVCGDCLTRFATATARCARCGLRIGTPAPACGACLREPPPFEHTACAVDYGFPWDRLIGEFKFNAREELAGPLAQMLADAVSATALPLADLVLPIPLSPPRLAERGFNQAWELARHAARQLECPASSQILLRPADTAHQAELSRAERQRNLVGAFMVDPRRRAAIQGLRVALVDDVMTTGATAREAAATVLRAGAKAVDLWMLARTPD
jgi:ComF family protein